MITGDIKRLVEENTLGLVATVTPDGAPAVSPKATVVVLDETRLAFSNLRSPKTIRNISVNPAVELNFVDVFRRQAARITGTARYVGQGTPECDDLMQRFSAWQDLQSRMKGIVVIDVTQAQLILSPAYDNGAKEDDMRRAWLETYTKLHGGVIGGLDHVQHALSHDLAYFARGYSSLRSGLRGHAAMRRAAFAALECCEQT